MLHWFFLFKNKISRNLLLKSIDPVIKPPATTKATDVNAIIILNGFFSVIGVNSLDFAL
jgi:hypothetical protein